MPVGVPLITQVDALILIPAGSAGELLQSVRAAPLAARVVGKILKLAPSEILFPVTPAKLRVGGFEPVESVTRAGADIPVELVAIILKVVGAIAALGVPLITQVVLLSVSVAGSAGVTLQLVMAAPRLFKMLGVILMATPTEPLVPAEPL